MESKSLGIKMVEKKNLVDSLYETLEKEKKQLEELRERITKMKGDYEKQVTESIEELAVAKNFKINKEELLEFQKKPYITIPKDKNEWYVIVPAYIPFQVGYFDRRENNFNVFIINKYTQWLNEIPDFLRDELKLEHPDEFKVIDNQLMFPNNLLGKVKEKFARHLKTIGINKAVIKKGHEFDLIAEIIDEGSLPFVPTPVQKQDLRPATIKFEMTGKYQYQADGLEEFMKRGMLGVYWMTGAGKSFIAMAALDKIKPPHLLITPSTTLIEQWKEYFKQYCPRLLNDVDIITYNGISKILREKKEYNVTVFDECDRLPANTFAIGATIKTKYRLGLSASPYREDGRTQYIFALTGYPIGLDWGALMNILGKKYHEVNIHIVANEKEKISKTDELIDFNKKTLIFCDSIELGKTVANKYKISHIHGKVKKRLKTLKEEQIVVVSRVGDYGISIPDLQHIIEIDFLFGSRKQQLQRTGRLFHGKGERHDILFTATEFEKHKKRLFSLIEKGFKLNFATVKKDLKLPEKQIKQVFKEKKTHEPIEEMNQLLIEEPIGEQDYAGFIAHPKIKELLKQALADTTQKQCLKGIIALLIERRKPVTQDQVRRSLGLSSPSNVSTAATTLEKYELIKKIKIDQEGQGGSYKGYKTTKKIQAITLNTEGLNEIINLSRQREKSKKAINDIFGEEE